MNILIITDGIFNNYDILDEMSFSGNIYIYDERFGPTPALRNPTDRNQLETYFQGKEGINCELISFNRNDDIIRNIDKIYVFTTKPEEKVKIEFVKYIQALTNKPIEYIFSLRKSYYNSSINVKAKTPQSLFKDMGLSSRRNNIDKNVREKMRSMKKRARSSHSKKKNRFAKELDIEGSPFVIG